MKLINIVFLLSLSYEFEVKSQTNIQNANKYWYYRQRLKQHFVEVDPNSGIGSNYPIDFYQWDQECNEGNGGYCKIDWGDGNAGLQFYISMLATEYKLLKKNGLNYYAARTRDELFYALETFDRLDYTAETYFTWSNTGEKGLPRLNGFFIRYEPVNIKGMKGGDDNSCKGDRPPENSKDNVWHYLTALALVRTMLYGDNTLYDSRYEGSVKLYEMAENIAYRIVSYMHDEGFFNDEWLIRNPVTKDEVEDCGGAPNSGVIDETPFIAVGYCGFQYGFAKAGEWISGRNLHFDDSEDDKDCFNNSAKKVQDDGQFWGWDLESFPNLYTVMGGHTDYLIKAKQMGWRVYYPHFVLIDNLLHGNYIKTSHPEFVQEYQNLLNSAPDCGPRNYSSEWGSYDLYWSSPNTLTWPKKKEDSPGDAKIYNGLDYMLLYNLFWLNYGDCIYSASSYSTAYSEKFAAQRSFDIVSLSSPTTKDENVTAKKVIFLKPGFSTKPGSNFTASVTGSVSFNDTKLVYSKETSPLTLTSTCASIPLRKARATVHEKSDTNTYIPDSISALNQEIAETEVPQDFYVLPNPTNGKLFIGFEKEINFHVLITDVMGRTLYSDEHTSKNFVTLDVTNYERGIYFMKISWGNYVKTIKLVKQ